MFGLELDRAVLLGIEENCEDIGREQGNDISAVRAFELVVVVLFFIEAASAMISIAVQLC